MNEKTLMEVLLVEDNLQDAELTIQALKDNNLAKNVIHIEDGMEALDLLFGRGKYEAVTNGDLPKVILLDLNSSNINGLELLRAIKENEKTRGIPVVIVTSSANKRDIKAAYGLGANSYIVKPTESEAFLKRMSALGRYWLLVNHSVRR